MITYTYRYNRVIQWFKAHKPAADILCEKHHIIPRSMGGDNSPNNLVDLPLRWLYIVHCCLPAMYAEQGNQEGYEKMLFAWNRMQNYRRGHRKALKYLKEDSKLYCKLREEFIKLSSMKGKARVGDNNGQFKHHWWKDPNDKTMSMSIKEGDPVPEGWVRGRWFSQEAHDRMTQNSHSKGKIGIFNKLTGRRKYISEEERSLYGDDWISGYSLFRKPKKPKHHKSQPKPRLSKEEILARKVARSKQYAEWVQQQLPLWKEMYQWYLDNGEDFAAMCDKYGYTKGRDAFLARARKYFPEIFKWNPHGGVRGSRPKTRGPYKKKK